MTRRASANWSPRALPVWLTTLLVAGHTASADVRLRTVALSGQQAAGCDTGVTYKQFFRPQLSSGGLMTFRADVQGSGVDDTNVRGGWIEHTAGALTLVARTGLPAPGGVTPQSFLYVPVGGEVFGSDVPVIYSRLAEPLPGGHEHSGYWMYRDGSLVSVAQTSLQAAGYPEGVQFYQLPWQFATSRQGHLAFRGRITSQFFLGDSSYGVWATTDGPNLRLVARGATAAPGTSGSTQFKNFSPELVKVNAAGLIAFVADVAGPDVTDANRQGFWAESASFGLQLAAREGTQAPGLDDGVTVSRLSDHGLAFSASGGIAFVGYLNLSPPTVTDANNSGIWLGSSVSDLRMVVREGDTAPGFQPAHRFSGWTGVPALNRSGQLAFVARDQQPGLVSSSAFGVWLREPDGSMRLISRVGSAAPGAEPGTVFAKSQPYELLWLTESGRLFIHAFVESEDGTSARRTGLWATNGDTGELELLVISGQEIDVDTRPDTQDLRTIDGVGFLGTDAINDVGEVGVSLAFADGSKGVFVLGTADTVPVCPGDINDDLLVDLSDLVSFLAIWQASIGQPASPGGIEDFNDDGDVDLEDLVDFVGVWSPSLGNGCP